MLFLLVYIGFYTLLLLVLLFSIFKFIFKKNNYVIVEFYRKLCKFWKLLAPEYNKLSEEYKNKKKDAVIYPLEWNDNDVTLRRYGIFRFPVIALFKYNSKFIYRASPIFA